MIIGIGCDLISVERVRGVFKRQGELFLRRYFDTEECDYCLSASDPAERIAARWAAKEAAAKALGTGIRDGLNFKDIAVHKNKLGAPILHFSDNAKEILTQRHISHHHCSLSHADGMALAYVIFESSS